jgi:AraC family transcriptional regulator
LGITHQWLFSTLGPLPLKHDKTLSIHRWFSILLNLPLPAMQHLNDLLTLAHKHPLMTHELHLLFEQEKQIPGSVQYSIQRYQMQQQWNMEDMGMLAYNCEAKAAKDKSIELRFCISGNRYCTNEDCTNGVCKKQSQVCKEPVATFDVFSFRYSATYLSQFVKGKTIQTKSDHILAFKQRQSFYTVVNMCNRTKGILENLLQHQYNDTLENIFVNSQLQTLLLYGLECLVQEKQEETFTCKFLANEADREKINHAREVLLQRIGDPITIKELSRKVGTNECYLKKGFKEMFGTTIFDFYQSQRMEHAKYLLYDKGLSVTDVSAMLGYSSISHFSTAFKKHTGLKPCELLFRA